MVTLIIDTSTQFLNIALMKEQQVITSLSKRVKTNHSSHVIHEIDTLLLTQQLTIKDVMAIAVAQGPGSYTGLRIGIAVAKMFAYTLAIPLYRFSSLALIALQGQSVLTIPLIDARRQAVYTGKCYHQQLTEERYCALPELMQQLNTINKEVCFVADDAHDLLEPYLSDLTVPYRLVSIERYDLTQCSKLQLIESDAFNMKPSYLRLSEAEANLSKNR